MKERKTKMCGLEKTTVRLIVSLPENIGRIQRLYDYGISWTIEEETITDVEELLDFVKKMKSLGAKMIHHGKYISDDDLQVHESVVYEY